ncbi:alpha/beta hydrolase family protein [Streptomyces sp. NPDC001709]
MTIPPGSPARRRTAAVAAAVFALSLPLLGAVPAAAAPAPVATRAAHETPAALPRPTGPHTVGRDTLHLVDTGRQDPWVPSSGARQLMVSMYYPARPGTGGPPGAYMTVEEARLLLAEKSVAFPPEALSSVRTWSHPGARPAPGRYPLVVLSPGFTLPRATLTGLAEDLASHGYVVALVDHPYENSGTTLPDGRTVPCAICDSPPAGGPPAIAGSRALDISFVLDELTGRRPAWRYARTIDPARIGMAGHSIGGDAAAATMAADDRVRAGVDMDGTFYAPVPATGLGHRPFLLLGETTSVKDDTWQQGWQDLDGWKRWLTVDGSDHGTFTDMPVLAELAGRANPDGLSGQRSEAITRAYVTAFFDRHLKGMAQPLLDGPSPHYPEVSVRLP